MKYISFLLFIFSSSAFGCSCAFSSIKTSYENSDAIFIGKVIAVDSSKYDFSSNLVYTYTFEIEKDFKRKWEDNSRKKFTTIYSPLRNMYGGCGISFQLNKKYIVYGLKDEYGTYTNICFRTLRLDLVEKAELDSLQTLENKFFKEKKDLIDVDYYGEYLDSNSELLIKFEDKIKSQKLQIDNEKQKSKNYLFGFLTSTIFLIISVFFFYLRRR